MSLVIVNPTDKSWTRHRYILAFGAYGWTKLLVWANSVDDALDEAVDWIEDHAPGLLCDEQVAEEYKRAIAEGKNEEEAFEESIVDTTCAGNHGHFILSYEWFIIAVDPPRSLVKELVAEA